MVAVAVVVGFVVVVEVAVAVGFEFVVAIAVGFAVGINKRATAQKGQVTDRPVTSLTGRHGAGTITSP